MKKAIFVAITVLISATCLGQQTISVNGVAKVDMPKGFEKITKEEAISLAYNRFKNNEMAIKIVSMRKSEHLYKVDNVLISFNSDDHQANANRLDELKNGFDGTFNRVASYTSYTSSLKTVNDNPLLILNWVNGGVGYYAFYMFNGNKSKLINGTLEFAIEDKDKATGILNHILAGVKFKE